MSAVRERRVRQWRLKKVRAWLDVQEKTRVFRFDPTERIPWWFVPLVAEERLRREYGQNGVRV